jgi:DNA-binding Lrp family transcriptional regulator
MTAAPAANAKTVVGAPAAADAIGDLDRRLLNDFQRGFPLSPTPYADIARALAVSEDEVLARLRTLQEAGAVSRVGAVVRPYQAGASTLAALAVPPAHLQDVAALVSGYPEVNHNYEREHRYNLWFVVTARDRDQVEQVLADIAARTALAPLDLPLVADYHIDLGFDIAWDRTPR